MPRALLFLCLLICATFALAQPFAELAGKAEAGRHQRLVEAARKEGSVTFYTSIPEKDMAVLAADFEQRYGVKVLTWRASWCPGRCRSHSLCTAT